MWRLKTLIKNPLIMGFVLCLCLAEPALAKNSFLVAPGRVDFDLSRPSTQSFIITNNGDGKIRLNIEPIYFEIDSQSLAAGVHLKPETAKLENITPYIRVSPRTLSLAAGQRRDIRISLRPPKDLVLGDYRSHLLVKMLETARVIKSKKAAGENAVGMQLNIKMETAVAIYGHLGERDPKLSISCGLNPDNNQFSLVVENTSPWRFDGMVSVFNAKSNNASPLHQERFVSLRESRRKISTSWKPKGRGPYLLKWGIGDAGESMGSSTCQVN